VCEEASLDRRVGVEVGVTALGAWSAAGARSDAALGARRCLPVRAWCTRGSDEAKAGRKA